jgi:membrane protein DedA with SNARE-associated domain
MDLIGIITQHGYAVTGGVLFLAALGIPMPVSLTLLAAGAAAAHGNLGLGTVLAIATLAGLIGDVLLYLGGRFTGWWLLALMDQRRFSSRSSCRDLERWRLRWPAV